MAPCVEVLPGDTQPFFNALRAEAVHAARHQAAVLHNACRQGITPQALACYSYLLACLCLYFRHCAMYQLGRILAVSHLSPKSSGIRASKCVCKRMCKTLAGGWLAKGQAWVKTCRRGSAHPDRLRSESQTQSPSGALVWSCRGHGERVIQVRAACRWGWESSIHKCTTHAPRGSYV